MNQKTKTNLVQNVGRKSTQIEPAVVEKRNYKPLILNYSISLTKQFKGAK